MWYIRFTKGVKGPYPAGLISRYILLGRVKDSDEVSRDGKEWLAVKDVPELIPKILKGDMNDPMVKERLEAARRWADERSLDRRAAEAGLTSAPEDRRGDDRRGPEHQPVIGHRLRRASREQEPSAASRGLWMLLTIAGMAAVIAAAFILSYKPPAPQLGTDCRSPAAPNVNWSNCVLDGARLEGRDLSGAKLYSASLTGANLRHGKLRGSDLSYAALSIADLQGADLRGAMLIGAKLRQARLNNADLEGADLSYADLTGADLSGANLNTAKLGNAIWIDGTRCIPQSVGACQTAPQ
jgi:hypothetical protein